MICVNKIDVLQVDDLPVDKQVRRLVKETRSVTMNIFRKKMFLFK